MTDTQTAIRNAIKVVLDIRCLDYSFEVLEGHGGAYLVGKYTEKDIYTGQLEVQRTRRWLISPYMTKSEVAQTAFKCVLTSMEHRAREHFLYKGRRVYGPHFDVDDLWELCKDREDAGGRK